MYRHALGLVVRSPLLRCPADPYQHRHRQLARYNRPGLLWLQPRPRRRGKRHIFFGLAFSELCFAGQPRVRQSALACKCLPAPNRESSNRRDAPIPAPTATLTNGPLPSACGLAYGVAGGWGNLNLPFQLFRQRNAPAHPGRRHVGRLRDGCRRIWPGFHCLCRSFAAAGPSDRRGHSRNSVKPAPCQYNRLAANHLISTIVR